MSQEIYETHPEIRRYRQERLLQRTAETHFLLKTIEETRRLVPAATISAATAKKWAPAVEKPQPAANSPGLIYLTEGVWNQEDHMPAGDDGWALAMRYLMQHTVQEPRRPDAM